MCVQLFIFWLFNEVMVFAVKIALVVKSFFKTLVFELKLSFLFPCLTVLCIASSLDIFKLVLF